MFQQVIAIIGGVVATQDKFIHIMYISSCGVAVYLICRNLISLKGKGKGHPITGHQGPRGGVEV
jgi:hypothetical protein